MGATLHQDKALPVTIRGGLWRALVLVVVLGAMENLWLRGERRWLLLAGSSVSLVMLVAAGVLAWPGWWRRAVGSVRTAAALFLLLGAACVVGTLIVQEPDLRSGAPGVDESAAFVERQGAFLWRLTHRTPSLALDEAGETYIAALARCFGARYASQEERDALRARSAEARDELGRAWAARHATFLEDLFRMLRAARLTDVFHAWWFAGLLSALAVNAVGCTLARRFTWGRAGVTAAHLGVVVVLGGAAVGRLTRETGRIPVAQGQESAVYWSDRTERPTTLPFSLVLERARTEHRKELRCTFPGPMGVALSRTFRVEPGMAPIRLCPAPADRPTRYEYTITLEEYLPRAWPAGTVEVVSTRPVRPAVEVRLERPGAGPVAAWLGAEPDDYAVTEDRTVKVRFRYAPTEADWEALLAAREEESFGTLTLSTSGGGAATIAVRHVGQEASCDLGGRTCRVAVLDIRPDFTARTTLLASRQAPRLPAVRVRLSDAAGAVSERWVFEDDRLQKMHPAPTALPDVTVTYAVDDWAFPAAERYVVIGGGGGRMHLVVHAAGRRVAALSLRAGTPVDVPPTGATFTLDRFVGHASFPLAADTQPAPPGELAYFDSTAEPGVRLRIDGPAGPDTVWLRANNRGYRYAGGDLHVAYLDNRRTMPNDYRALVGVKRDGQVVQQSVVQVNRPLRYGGYLFYQVDPGYREMLVVYDPSLPAVCAGLVLVMAGVAGHFLVLRPLRGRTPPPGRRKMRSDTNQETSGCQTPLSGGPGGATPSELGG
jgi:hypothetical protein